MRKQVLIVDISATVQKIVKTTLPYVNYAVTETKSGKRTLDHPCIDRIDHLMSDLNTPIMFDIVLN